MKYKVMKIAERPGLYMVKGFLTARECEQLIALSKKDKMYQGGFGGPKELNEDQSSMTYFFDKESKVIDRINQRISDLTKFPLSHSRTTMIMRYGLGGKYMPHNDYMYFRNPNKARIVAQMLLYLNDVEEGGETYFVNLGIKFVPKKGDALLWYGVCGMDLPDKKAKTPNIPKNLRADPFAIHVGTPILKGEKWVCLKFLLTGKDDKTYPSKDSF